MEAKKSPKADLEKKKGLYLEIGLVVILALVLLAFNIKNYDEDDKIVVQEQAAVVDEADVEITDPNDPPPPPPEEPEAPQTEFEVVDNNEEADDIVVNVEDNANATQEQYVPPAPPANNNEDLDDEILQFAVIEDAPEFPGGEAELYKYLGKNIKYPQMARDQNIEGRVFVTFVIEKDGSIANPKVLRDIGGGCGEEALRVVRSMPKWKPGKQRGKTVRVQFNLPVAFQLE